MLTDKLTAIAAAIREKGGTTEKMTLDAMAAAIAALEVGGGGSGDDSGVPNPILIEKDGSAVICNTSMNWVIENFGDRIQTSDLNSCSDMFKDNGTIENIPFDINCSTTGKISFASAFYCCSKLKSISGSINNANVDTMRYMFYGCNNLRELPVFNNLKTTDSSSMAFGDMFKGCYSLRSIPESLLKMLGNSSVFNTNGTVFNGFSELYAVDEIVGISPKTKEMTSNVFTNNYKCYRVKRFVFNKQENGNPYIVSWKNQTINLYDSFGWLTVDDSYITTKYNSGITVDKKVYDSLSYQALKNDADWYSGMPQYSRFNHDSAVELINSLPDTSAYLSANGGTNTIKLRNGAGALTDGGSCGSLTEEEIAVATAKGWTITYEI